ncbi:carbonate dehydratase [Gynuella sp.]|uniref:carbonate dehydratase n=1 Tax=Gynuella sp. TaxID=2969146 RepID=UPI003D0BCB7C
MNLLEHLLENNKRWAKETAEKDPEFFGSLANIQNPEVLWIGCADSRVPANEILGLLPGDVFVHRNVANIVVHSDLNCLSVIQYAIDVLKIKHVIVCGHLGCGGVRAAVEKQQNGLIDNWLRHIQDIMLVYDRYLRALDAEQKNHVMCRINALAQALNVAETTVLSNAWSKGQEVNVHAWVYSLENGLVENQGVTLSGPENAREKVTAKIREILLAANKR